MDYTEGLHDLGRGCHAWLQPDGSWGWSNSGLVTGSGQSLMVDTLFDLAGARRMLDAISPVTDTHPVATVVNTHSDGDHYFGNELVAGEGVEIIASEAAAELMNQEAVDALAGVKRLDSPTGEFAREIFGPFEFEGITSTGPTRTFSGETSVDVGGREVALIQVGPAHTPGDTLVHVPDAGILYSGDILFIGGTPIAWAGPISRWIGACDRILDMDVTTIVPGHGPVTDKTGVHRVREYLTWVEAEARKRFADGLDVDDAIASIDLGDYAALPEYGRLAQNVINVYQELDPAMARPDRLTVLGRIAALEGFGEKQGEQD
ncbi:glyoxylase-like metal-dependent hydrolase (beta-lactamase superfamily II) [Pseudonocardia sediminis]|uniref:Glyoxylase-like metal-dependent hydrolase (Beta-lactamase superfamily II) n=1 Tax=Pseudonocardia sediminis TaxID=1397368 RepID=A0A4Q7V5N6_PSEST|nr:MBL fold metallo-hydrolase [Pseudonocardia sediminis]RZT88891.1 glyoxylase-like metal-dependent hydrolase (beta-lactamase superfamily II) [Pseudonocardia sediminis]